MQAALDQHAGRVSGDGMGFDDLVIPEQVKRTLRSSVRTHRLPPAYLFIGPAGLGKHATAVSLAQALNCLGSMHDDACGRCMACVRIGRQVHPDIHTIEPQGQAIKIDQIRQLQEVLTLQAYEARVKVAILDDAGQLTIEAANSLLKILEEPPSQTLFVLVSQQLGTLPATLISRAQVLRFGVMPAEQIAPWLCQQARPPSEAQRTALLSGGRPGVALTMDLAAVLDRRSDALNLLTEALAGNPSVALLHAEVRVSARQTIPSCLPCCFRSFVMYRLLVLGAAKHNSCTKISGTPCILSRHRSPFRSLVKCSTSFI